ncbi:hypothetical protein M3Y99_00965400 [Aphelenchoides fujianensis]|nr:hypothetical protein M3Y99_00965400 [Aphelenchoides fujianensis]
MSEEIPCTSIGTNNEVGFRYTWNPIGNGEWTILNVSPVFCTGFNGVQFTWLLRLCDEHVLPEARDEEGDFPTPSRRFVNVLLYYKNGPSEDVKLAAAKISVEDAAGQQRFLALPLSSLEFTKGSGWPPHADLDERSRLSEFIEENVGKGVKVTVELKMGMHLFHPLGYLPPLNKQLHSACEQVLEKILTGEIHVPDAEFYDQETDRFLLHRHCYNFGVAETRRQCANLSIMAEEVENVFANVYFDRVIEQEAQCFEDYVEVLVECSNLHFLAFRKECERAICREVMADSADVPFIQKTLLLAERFGLKVLKMVAFGVMVDRLSGQHDVHDSVEDIRAELIKIADQIQIPSPTVKRPSSPKDEAEDNELLVGSIIGELEQLAKHIRKVSGPGLAPCGSPVAPRGRRSSLKTSRELLSFQAFASGSVDHGRRRSVIFAPTDEPRRLVDSPFSSSASSSSRVLADEHSALPEEHEDGESTVDEPPPSEMYADRPPLPNFSATSTSV